MVMKEKDVPKRTRSKKRPANSKVTYCVLMRKLEAGFPLAEEAPKVAVGVVKDGGAARRLDRCRRRVHALIWRQFFCNGYI